MNKLIFAILLVLALGIEAAPSDYVQLYSHTPTLDYKNPTFETIYKISLPALAPSSIAVTENDFKVSYRNDELEALSKPTDKVSESKMEISTDLINWQTLEESKLDFTFSKGQEYYLRVSGKARWVPSGTAGEQMLEPIDNVLTAFGHDYTEYAWAIPTLVYRRQIKLTNPNVANYNDFVLNITFDARTPQQENKMANDCSDIRFTWANNATDESEIPFYLYADMGLYGATGGSCASASTTISVAHVRVPTIFYGLNATTLYYYYGGSLPSNQTNLTYHFIENWKTGINNTRWKNGTNYGFAGNCNSVGICGVDGQFGSYYAQPSGGQNIQFAINNNTLTKFSSDNLKNNNYSAIFLYKESSDSRFLPTDRSTFIFNNVTNGIYQPIQVFYRANEYGCRDLNDNSSCENDDYTFPYPSGAVALIGWYVLSTITVNATNITIVNDAPIAITSSYSGAEEINGSIATFYMRALDETTLLPIYFNATISNGFNITTTTNGISYSAFNYLLPSGTNTITVYNASYYQRQYSINIGTDKVNLTTYLIPISYANANYVNFHVIDSAGVPISSALVTVNKTISGSSTTVTSCNTDGSGTCQVILDSLATYLVLVSKTGYTTSSSSINPVGSDYTITLAGGANPTYSPISDGISYSLEPPLFDAVAGSTVINYTIFAENSNLAFWGLTVIYQGGTIYAQNDTNANGGTILINITTLNKVGNVTVNALWQTTGSIKTYQRYYYLLNNTVVTNYSVSRIFEMLRVNAPSPYMLGVPILILIAFVVGTVNRRMPIGAGTGILAVGMLAFMMYAMVGVSTGINEWLVIAFLAILAIAMVRIRTVG